MTGKPDNKDGVTTGQAVTPSFCVESETEEPETRMETWEKRIPDGDGDRGTGTGYQTPENFPALVQKFFHFSTHLVLTKGFPSAIICFRKQQTTADGTGHRINRK